MTSATLFWVTSKGRLCTIGTVARVLYAQPYAGTLGSVFPIYLVRLTDSRRDRWALRLRGRWVLFRARTAAKRHTCPIRPLLHFATVPRTVGA
jgi:hypothetical protein